MKRLNCAVLAVAISAFFAIGLDAFAAELALINGRIYPSPDTASIENGTVIISGDKIVAIGPSADIKIPATADIRDIRGMAVTAGFWNSHVHFSQPNKWFPAETMQAGQLSASFRDMLTQYGFIYVLDTGSPPRNTLALRRRISSGEVVGPSIMMAGGSFVPKGASPFYVRPDVLPDAPEPEQAQRQVYAVLGFGAEGIKIFSGSYAAFDRIVPMKLSVVSAITAAAHARGSFVVAHPSNGEGASVAIDGGVDILAHTFPDGSWEPAMLAKLAQRGGALIPTMKLFRYEAVKFSAPEARIQDTIRIIQEQVRTFIGFGGQILFGTDVGYMHDYDPTDEYAYMAGAGMTPVEILASLTTAPAQRFGLVSRTGQLRPGFDADVVVLESDPAQDPRNFAKATLVIKGGRIIFERPVSTQPGRSK